MRSFGLLGFERSGPLKKWVTGRAMGTRLNSNARP